MYFVRFEKVLDRASHRKLWKIMTERHGFRKIALIRSQYTHSPCWGSLQRFPRPQAGCKGWWDGEREADPKLVVRDGGTGRGKGRRDPKLVVRDGGMGRGKGRRKRGEEEEKRGQERGKGKGGELEQGRQLANASPDHPY